VTVVQSSPAWSVTIEIGIVLPQQHNDGRKRTTREGICWAASQHPVTQIGGGHRERRYCTDACKQRASQMRQEEKRREALRQRWAGYRPRTQTLLESVLRRYDLEIVALIVQALEAERA
jgi:hypothetical protein